MKSFKLLGLSGLFLMVCFWSSGPVLALGASIDFQEGFAMPLEVTVDESIDLHVVSFDEFGNILSNSTDPIDFRIYGDENCTVLATDTVTTIIPDDSGVAVFSFNHGILGSTSVGATNGAASACLGVFQIIPGAMDLYLEQAPQGGNLADQPLSVQPVFRYEDIYGNQASDNLIMTASVLTGAGLLRNNIAILSGGRFTFDNLGYSLSGESDTVFNFEVSNQDLDIVIATTTPIPAVLSGSISRLTWATSSELASTYKAGEEFSYAVDIFDIFDNKASIATLSVATLDAGLLNGTTSVQSLDGMALFDNSIDTVGEYGLSVTVAGIVLSQNITITPGDFDHFNLDNLATSTMAGQAISFFLTAYDAKGNIKTDYNGGANVVTTESQNITYTDFVDGGYLVAPSVDYPESDLIFYLAGTQGFDVYDDNANLQMTKNISVLSDAPDVISVDPSALNDTGGLVGGNPVNQPLSMIIVNAYDVYGNPVSDGTLVQAVLANGQGVLRNYTATTSAGMATFDQLGYSIANETDTIIKFVIGSLESATYGLEPLAVTSSQSLVWQTLPVTSIVSGTVLPGFSVMVVDDFGNQVDSESQFVATLSLGSLTGSSSLSSSVGFVNFDGLIASGTGQAILTVTSGSLSVTSLLRFINSGPSFSSYPAWLLPGIAPIIKAEEPPYKITPGMPVKPGLPSKVIVGKQVLGEKIYAVGSLLRGVDKKVYQVLSGHKLRHIKTLKELHSMKPQMIYKLNKEQLSSYVIIK